MRNAASLFIRRLSHQVGVSSRHRAADDVVDLRRRFGPLQVNPQIAQGTNFAVIANSYLQSNWVEVLNVLFGEMESRDIREMNNKLLADSEAKNLKRCDTIRAIDTRLRNGRAILLRLIGELGGFSMRRVVFFVLMLAPSVGVRLRLVVGNAFMIKRAISFFPRFELFLGFYPRFVAGDNLILRDLSFFKSVVAKHIHSFERDMAVFSRWRRH
jgi:hypothetical protein